MEIIARNLPWNAASETCRGMPRQNDGLGCDAAEISTLLSSTDAYRHTHQNLTTQTVEQTTLTAGWIGRPGGFGGGPAPDPFPNSAVKTPSAHGTVS